MSNQSYEDQPNSLRALESMGNKGRPRIFDPALRHFRYGFKLGDFLSPSWHERLEWEMARASVRNHLLQLVSRSRWKEHLVLRGSVLMQVWFGEKARDPNDIDWVFQPQSVQVTDSICKECLDDLIEMIQKNPRTKNSEILTSHLTLDDIHAYDFAAGRRLVVPFQSDGGGQREIQMDIVWGEELFEPPVLTSIPTRDGDEISLWTATRQLSLAWKLLWLATDAYSQGKDLYDAVLLAESTPLSLTLLRRMFDRDEWYRDQPLTLATFNNLYIDWENFKLEFPWIEGEAAQWQQRLNIALAPTFATAA